jgi:hypothetical protein
MKKAISLIASPVAVSGSADLKRSDGAICKKAQVGAELITPNRTQDRLSIQSLGRLMV